MTRAEYNRAYAKARRSAWYLTRAVMRELKEVYIDAGKEVAAEVRRAILEDLSPLTIQSGSAVQQALELGANSIRDHLAKEIPESIQTVTKRVSKIDNKYLSDFSPIGRGVTIEGIRRTSEIVISRVLASVVNRIFTDGYSFSDRIWLVGTDYRIQINRVISTGYAQGRDPVKIAKDIEVYIADGKIKLSKRYGPNLKAESKRFLKRVRQKIDYRALRLVRSELYMSLQDSGRESGRANPGALNEYYWVLNPNRQEWGCVCPDNAAGSPYEYNDVPGYSHPNCMCRVVAKLKDRGDFLRDLKAWGNGQDMDYLDQWYREYYLPSNP